MPGGMSDNPFMRHPREVGENYCQHLMRASAAGVKLIAGGLACMVHAVFPFLFEHAASDTVRELHQGISKKVDAPNWERHPII